MPPLSQCIAEDYARYSNKHGSVVRYLIKIASHPGFRAVVLYRLSYKLRKRGRYRLAGLSQRIMFHTCYCEIGAAAEIGPGFLISHTVGLVIGGATRIGHSCDVRQNVTFGGNFSKTREDGQTQPHLGDNVSVGAGAVIVGPIKIGNGAVIGANTVLTVDIPPRMIAAGMPGRVIRKRWDETSTRRL